MKKKDTVKRTFLAALICLVWACVIGAFAAISTSSVRSAPERPEYEAQSTAACVETE